jgi:hypothetical protein
LSSEKNKKQKKKNKENQNKKKKRELKSVVLDLQEANDMFSSEIVLL